MQEPVTKQDLKEALELQLLKIQLIAGVQVAVALFFALLLMNAYVRH